MPFRTWSEAGPLQVKAAPQILHVARAFRYDADVTDEEEPDKAVVRCTRCSTAPPGEGLNVVRWPCAYCGAKVWIERELPEDIEQEYPDKPLVVVCMECPVPEGVGDEVLVTNGQIIRLLATGVPPAKLAKILAIGAVTPHDQSLEDTLEVILAQPGGIVAHNYEKKLTEMKIRVSNAMRRN